MTNFTEKVAIANNAFVINLPALTELVNSGQFYDLADKETMYSVSNRKQLVAAMFASCNAGRISSVENVKLQTVTKGYNVEALIEAAEAIKTPVVVVDEVAELVAELRALLAVALKAEQDAVNLAVELTSENQDLKRSIRVQANSGVTTKVYNEVASKVGI